MPAQASASPSSAWSSSGRPRVRGRPRPLHPRGAGCRGPTRGARRAQGQSTRCRGPCGCGGTEGQRFGRAGHLIRHHGGSTGPASLRAASRSPAARGAESASCPGLSPEDAPRPAPIPARRTAREGSQRVASRSTADSEDAGLSTQPGRGLQSGGGAEACSPKPHPSIRVQRGPFPGAALCPPDTPSPRWALEAWTLCLPGAEDALRRDAPRGAHPSPFSLPGLRAPNTFPQPSLQRVNWVPLTGS